MIASGDPKKLLAECENPTVRAFLTRGGDHAGVAPIRQQDDIRVATELAYEHVC